MSPVTPGTRSGNGGAVDLDVGDAVDVPGGMHGTVRFIGNVKGKNGIFAGVELSREYAQRGKNDGDVDGVRYFTTSVPRSGIFLPIARASRRVSPPPASGPFPLGPSTPSMGGLNTSAQLGQQQTAQRGYSPPTPSIPNLSQSVGPGRAASPIFKPRSRPSLPRPESPVRRQQNPMGTPAGRPSLGPMTAPRPGGSRYAPSPIPGKFASTMEAKRNSNSFSGDPGKRFGVTATPEPKVAGGRRAQSALGNRSSREVDSEAARIGLARTSNSSQNSTLIAGIRSRGTSVHGDEEIASLKAKLEERDRQLKEQAASLAEMESSLTELQSLIPSSRPEGPTRSKSHNGADGADVTQLRALLREKNEKIAMLTGEFDAHRADFRSTIDTLELASTETERVYEKRVEELVQEIRDLQERSEDVESVALQLKQLEELVQELEEGLEDARRGEAEARGEVEFLRGEVERGRSELRREREKAATAFKGAGAVVNGGGPNTGIVGAKEVEQRDDEIRGLKAIIHSLSRDSISAQDHVGSSDHNGQLNGHASNRRLSQQIAGERAARDQLEREIKELRDLVERKTHREIELERELEDLRKDHHPATFTQQLHGTSHEQPKDIVPFDRAEFHSRPQININETFDPRPHDLDRDPGPSSADDIIAAAAEVDDDDIPLPWCGICDKEGHDMSTCPNIDDQQAREPSSSPSHTPPQQQEEVNEPTITTNTTTTNLVPAQPSASLGLQRRGRDVVLEGLKRLSAASSSPKQQTFAAEVNLGETHSQRKDLAETTPLPPPASEAQSQPPEPARQPDPLDMGLVAGKASKLIDPDKWCALCENDGHESVDCPFEDVFA